MIRRFARLYDQAIDYADRSIRETEDAREVQAIRRVFRLQTTAFAAFAILIVGDSAPGLIHDYETYHALPDVIFSTLRAGSVAALGGTMLGMSLQASHFSRLAGQRLREMNGSDGS